MNLHPALHGPSHIATQPRPDKWGWGLNPCLSSGAWQEGGEEGGRRIWGEGGEGGAHVSGNSAWDFVNHFIIAVFDDSCEAE